MKKKLLSIVLALAMVLVALPVGAFATNQSDALEMVSQDTRRVYKENYLTFTAEEENSTVIFRFIHAKGVLYRTKGKDDANWSSWQKPFNGPFYKTIVLEHVGDQVQYMAGGFTMSLLTPGFSMTGKIAASGSVTSLLDYNGGNPYVELSEGCFAYLFSGCDSLTAAPELPALTLAPNCYWGMFHNCENLIYAPALPATHLEPNCYREMFAGCTSLDITYEYSEEYANAWIIPYTYNYHIPANWNRDMFLRVNPKDGDANVVFNDRGADLPQTGHIYYQRSLSYITLAESCFENGTTAYSKRGSEVTVLCFPEDGFVVDSIKVYKTGDEETEVVVKDAKFQMPDYPVTIEVVYGIPFTEITENTATVTVRYYNIYNYLALCQGRFGVHPEESLYVVFHQDDDEYCAWFYNEGKDIWFFVPSLDLEDLLSWLDKYDGYVIGTTTENPISEQFTFTAPENLVYDGEAKEALVTTDKEQERTITVRYYDSEGEELTEAPKNAGVYSVKIDVTKGTKYEAIEELGDESWTFEITKRNLVLRSDSATKKYDGVALKCLAMIVEGDGFVEGEGATYEYTNSLTKVGYKDNAFTYEFNEGTLEGNYEVTTMNGSLIVTLTNPQKNTLDITKDNVTLEDKTNVEKAIKDYQKLLKEEELEEEEISGYEEDVKRLQDALQAIKNAEEVIELIEKLPAKEDLKVEDNDQIQAAIDAYNKLTDNEKLMVGETNLELVKESREQMADLKDQSYSPQMLEGKDQTISQIFKQEASFRSEAPLYQFLEVKLDGEVLDPENYTLTEGSTIVTLKPEFVKTLKNGEHTIDIVSLYGTASSSFWVKDYYFWLCVGLAAALVVIIAIVASKNKKKKAEAK